MNKRHFKVCSEFTLGASLCRCEFRHSREIFRKSNMYNVMGRDFL